MIDTNKLTAYALGRHLTNWRYRNALSLYEVAQGAGIRIESLKNVELGKGQIPTLIAYQMFILEKGNAPLSLWDAVIYELHQSVKRLREIVPHIEEAIVQERIGVSDNRNLIGRLFAEADHLFAVLLLDRDYLGLNSFCSTETLSPYFATRKAERYALERFEIIMGLIEDLFPDQTVPHHTASLLFYHTAIYRSATIHEPQMDPSEYIQLIKILAHEESRLSSEEQQQFIDHFFNTMAEKISNATEKKLIVLNTIFTLCLYLGNSQPQEPYDFYLALCNTHPSNQEYE